MLRKYVGMMIKRQRDLDTVETMQTVTTNWTSYQGRFRGDGRCKIQSFTQILVSALEDYAMLESLYSKSGRIDL